MSNHDQYEYRVVRSYYDEKSLAEAAVQLSKLGSEGFRVVQCVMSSSNNYPVWTLERKVEQ